MKELPELTGGDKFPLACPVCAAEQTHLAQYACGARYERIDRTAGNAGESTEGSRWGGICPRDLPGTAREPSEADLDAMESTLTDEAPHDSVIGMLERAQAIKAALIGARRLANLSRTMSVLPILFLAPSLSGCSWVPAGDTVSLNASAFGVGVGMTITVPVPTDSTKVTTVTIAPKVVQAATQPAAAQGVPDQPTSGVAP